MPKPDNRPAFTIAVLPFPEGTNRWWVQLSEIHPRDGNWIRYIGHDSNTSLPTALSYATEAIAAELSKGSS